MPKRYTPNDKFSQKAAAEGYRARSVYKLEEIDSKHKLLRRKMTVLDLGAAPGSWLQYVAEKLQGTGRLIGIDLQEIEPIEGVETHVCDFTDHEQIASILNSSPTPTPTPNPTLDLLLSDAAPATSGIKDVDQWKSIELCHAVLDVADRFLKPNGTVVMKVFRGADFDEFLAELKTSWQFVKVMNVKASRDRSREVFVVCQKKAIGS